MTIQFLKNYKKYQVGDIATLPNKVEFTLIDKGIAKENVSDIVDNLTYEIYPSFILNDSSLSARQSNSTKLQQAYDSLPNTGGVIYFPGDIVYFSEPHVFNKRVMLRGPMGFISRPYFIPTVANSTWITWTKVSAPSESLTDESQIDGPGLASMKVRSNRSIRANAFKFVNCDNIIIDNVFVMGFKGSSFVFQRCREPYVNGVRTRFNGNVDSNPNDCAPDLKISSSEGTGDTSNFWYASQFYIIYPFGNGLEIDGTAEMNFDNLMVHHFPKANTTIEGIVTSLFGGSLGFDAGGVARNQFAALHESPGTSALSVSGRNWDSPFLSTKPVLIRDSNKVKLGRGRILGGATEHVIWCDNSELFLSDLYVEAAATTQYSSAFTVAGNVLTASGKVPETGCPVQVSTTGTLPTPLVRRTTYYVVKLSATTFSLASSYNNAISSNVITLSGGSGTHTVTSLGGYGVLSTSNSKVYHSNTGFNNCFGSGFADDSSTITGTPIPLGASGIIGSPAIQQNTGEELLFSIRNASMDITTDQAFKKVYGGRRYFITRVVAKGVSGNASAAVGGIYTSASKAGNVVVASSQSYTSLTGANTAVEMTRAAWALANASALGSDSGSSLYFSLTTPGAAGSVADILIYGVVVD